jgi:hypothetical protein
MIGYSLDEARITRPTRDFSKAASCDLGEPLQAPARAKSAADSGSVYQIAGEALCLTSTTCNRPGRYLLCTHFLPELFAVDADVTGRTNAKFNRVSVDSDNGDGQITVRHENPFTELATEDEHGLFLHGSIVVV